MKVPARHPRLMEGKMSGEVRDPKTGEVNHVAHCRLGTPRGRCAILTPGNLVTHTHHSGYVSHGHCTSRVFCAIGGDTSDSGDHKFGSKGDYFSS